MSDVTPARGRVWLEVDGRHAGAVCIDVISGKRVAAVVDLVEGTELAGVAFPLYAGRYLGVYAAPASPRRVLQLGRRGAPLLATTTARHRSLLGVASMLSVRDGGQRVFVAFGRSRQALGRLLDPVSYDELDKQADDPLYSAAILIDSLVSFEAARTNPGEPSPLTDLPGIDPATERDRSDAAWRATAGLRKGEPLSKRSAMLFNLCWPTLFSATAAGALPWWSPALAAVWVAALATFAVYRGWDGWEHEGVHPGGSGRDGQPSTWTFALIVAAASVIGGVLVGPFAGVAVTAVALALRQQRRRSSRRRKGWPKHSPSARSSMVLTQPLMLELVTAFAGVGLARPSLVGDMLGAELPAVERAVEQLRTRGYLELGRFDGTETTLGLSEHGRAAYAEHLRSIAPPNDVRLHGEHARAP